MLIRSGVQGGEKVSSPRRARPLPHLGSPASTARDPTRVGATRAVKVTMPTGSGQSAESVRQRRLGVKP